MPKEQIRKRGKRKPKESRDTQPSGLINDFTDAAVPDADEHNEAGPSSGIHPARAAMLAGQRPHPSHQQQAPAYQSQEVEQTLEWGRDLRAAEYPFGELDPDLKGYFRTVDDQIRDWEGVPSAGEEREDRQTFLNSVLSELRGQELAVSTDPDTSIVLERLMPSLGDWGRRVIGDAFGDQWEILLRHRFGSHVAQTWFNLAAGTLDREARGTFPPQQAHSKAIDSGSLPTMTAIITSILNLLEPTISSLLTNPHASPPLRLLLLVCTPSRSLPSLTSQSEKGDFIRSKKSGRYRKGHGVQGKSIFDAQDALSTGSGEQAGNRKEALEVLAKRREVTAGLLDAISEVEWRSMAINEVGSAAVQLLVDLEVEDGNGMSPGSLLDHLTEGLITSLQSSSSPSPTDYPASLLSLPIGSRVFETLIRVSPPPVFDALWNLYFEGKIGRLAIHPYANFVVAAGVARLDREGVERVVKECRAVNGGRGLIKTARTGVLQALAARCMDLPDCGLIVLELIKSALDLLTNDINPFVPCLMALRIYPVFKAIKTGEAAPDDDLKDMPLEETDTNAEEAAAAAARLEGWKNRRNPRSRDSDLAPNMQGSLLLQAMARIESLSGVVVQSLVAQDVETLMGYASHPISSRLLDTIIQSPAVSPKDRRKVIMAFLERFKDLAQDKSGSWVAQAIWDKADGYMKEKIGRSLIPHATELASSQYGRFLYNTLDLFLLERRPSEWRAKHVRGIMPMEPQSIQSSAAEQNGLAETTSEDTGKIEKKRRKEKDEIDVLFASTKKSKTKV